jgi:hypothetical protein
MMTAGQNGLLLPAWSANTRRLATTTLEITALLVTFRITTGGVLCGA